jgi:hypothetical protein
MLLHREVDDAHAARAETAQGTEAVDPLRDAPGGPPERRGCRRLREPIPHGFERLVTPSGDIEDLLAFRGQYTARAVRSGGRRYE